MMLSSRARGAGRHVVGQLGGLTARGAGRTIAAAVAVLARARRADKPMHPRGEVLAGRLRLLGGAGTGAAFLDQRAEHDVLLRFSRSAGLPTPWPDVNGLAVRVPGGEATHPYADLLMSTTGTGRLGRYVLVPTVRGRGGFLGTLVPYRTPTGPVHLGAREVGATTWELVWARPRSAWRAYALLELGDAVGTDSALSFDAVVAAPPGLEVYGWHRAVRGPGYAAARRSRGAAALDHA